MKMDGGRPSIFNILEIDTFRPLLPICKVKLLDLTNWEEESIMLHLLPICKVKLLDLTNWEEDYLLNR